jgi:hypothetical protein
MMSDRWADYLISHVRYADGRIAKVLAWSDLGAMIGHGRQMDRHRMLELLRQGTTFVTITRVDADALHWRQAEEVRLVKVDGDEFIRVGPRPGQGDHLGELSRF